MKDMINSTVIPTQKLQKIFRQESFSHIIANAHKINTGITDLVEADDFKFIEANDPKK